MNKLFRSELELRNNALRLSERIYSDSFYPNVIYVSLRGGAFLGNIISEFFKLVSKQRQQPVFYAAVVAHSYSGFSNTKSIRIDGWTYKPEYLRSGDKILLVDEIYDSGNTMTYFAEVLQKRGIRKEDIRIAVHDYKVRQYKEEDLLVEPDYYCFKHEIPHPDEDIWIHYLTHELIGLTKDELVAHYPEDIKDMLSKYI